MPVIIDLRADIQIYLQTHGLLRKWQKAKALFENDPSLNTELLEPRHRPIYSFRFDGKYRAIFIRPSGDTVEIIAVTKHYRKYSGPRNLDSVISYTWDTKRGGPSGRNAQEVSAFI